MSRSIYVVVTALVYSIFIMACTNPPHSSTLGTLAGLLMFIGGLCIGLVVTND